MNTGPFSPVAQVGAGPDGAAFQANGPEGEAELRLLGPAWTDPVRREALLKRLRRARLVEHAGVRRILGLGLDAVPPWLALAPMGGKPLADAAVPMPATGAARV